jgi:hypothetical protein
LFESDGAYWIRNSGGGGIAALFEDPNPTLGNDLDLNGFGVKGQIESQECIIDGGLI